MPNTYMTAIQQRAEHAQRSAPEPPPPPVQPYSLINQLRDHLATLSPAQRQRISIPAILPHLKGKYADQPHLLHVARALRQLGYIPVRSWKKDDHARRYWRAPEAIQPR